MIEAAATERWMPSAFVLKYVRSLTAVLPARCLKYTAGSANWSIKIASGRVPSNF